MSTDASQPSSDALTRLVLMGVSGCGKTSVGEALARDASFRFVDGDALHPPSNIAKMSAGIPLTDADRWPWLAKVGETLRDTKTSIAIGCSALKRSYRDAIRAACPHPVVFVLLDGSHELIAARMHARVNHFMPESLLDSQFATLERPAADEHAITVSIDQPVQAIAAEILRRLADRHLMPGRTG